MGVVVVWPVSKFGTEVESSGIAKDILIHTGLI